MTLTTDMDTCCGKHRPLVDVSLIAQSLGRDYSVGLVGVLYVTGEDRKGNGNVAAL